MDHKSTPAKAGSRMRFIGAVLILLSMALIIGGNVKALRYEGPTVFYLDPKAGFDSVTLEWKNIEAERFVIYRTDVSEIDPEDDPAPDRSDYEEIASVGGETTTFTDTDVEYGHTYAYYIDGYKERRIGGDRISATSFEDRSMTYQTAGLARPDLFNDGYGEFHTNDSEAIYLYFQSYTGVAPTDAEVYRRALGKAGEEETPGEFEKIPLKCPDGEDFNGEGCSLMDDGITPGTVYEYKCRGVLEKDGKTYRSEWSETVRIPVVNFTGVFTCETKDGGEPGNLTISLTSDKGNGTLFIAPDAVATYMEKDVDYDSLSVDDYPTVILEEVSEDGKNWRTAPEDGVTLQPGKTLWLRFTPHKGPSPAGKTVISLGFSEGSVKYDGPGSGESIMELDLKKGEGSVYLEWD